MRLKKRLLAWLFATIVVFPLLVDAQATLTAETFEAQGAVHLVRYEVETEHLAASTREAVDRSIAALLPLFDAGASAAPFQVVIDLLAATGDGDEVFEADAGIEALDEVGEPLGDGALTDAEACHVRVYTHVVPEAYLPFTIAHEMAHCFQDHYLNAAFNAADAASDWWVEGTAEWMATLVYPALATPAMRDGVSEPEWLYAEDHFVSVTDTTSANDFYGGYGAVYFWQFLSTEVGGVVEMLRALSPAAVTEEAYQDYLVGQVSDDTEAMRAFGLALARQQVAYQPSAAGLYGVAAPVISLPLAVPVDMNDFSVSLSAFSIIPSDIMDAVRIVTEGLPDSSGGITVSVNTEGDTFTPINDGSPVTLCVPSEGVTARIVASRGDGDSEAPFSLRFVAVSDPDAPCENPPRLEASPACAVGRWQLTNNPIRQLAFDQMGPNIGTGGSPGITLVTIGEDGSIAYTIENFVLVLADPSMPSGGSMTMNAAVSGRMFLSPDLDGTLIVSDLNWRIDSLSALANINGFEMDMSDIVLGAGEAAGELAPTPARIECIGDTYMDWWVVIDGERYTWHFSRIE